MRNEFILLIFIILLLFIACKSNSIKKETAGFINIEKKIVPSEKVEKIDCAADHEKKETGGFINIEKKVLEKKQSFFTRIKENIKSFVKRIYNRIIAYIKHKIK